MADDKKPADAKKDEKAEATGGGKGKTIILVVVVLLVAVLSSVGGALVAPKLLGQPAAAEKPKPKHNAEEADEEEEGPETPIFSTLPLDSMIVDVRNDEGEFHHLKISVALEIKVKVPEEELKGFVPRARDAQLTYLRTLSPADVVSTKRYETIRKELSDRIIKAVGKKFVKKILITDFVVQ
jgi:hypothetical protein